MTNSKKILILGGTGAMGRYLVDILSKSNEWDIYVTTRNSNQESIPNVTYVVGNARNYEFINSVCQNNNYDVIVDFMNYNLDEFESNHKLLLESTDHYLFLSSSRVYSNREIITEDTPRLLDVVDDSVFLKTNRYALRKAREENILFDSNYNNWTIIRPYITYSDRRLQLGIYEKEEWLYRLLNDKPLVLRQDILDKSTTLTYGYDVAKDLYSVITNNTTKLKAINLVTSESVKWNQILDLYLTIIMDKTGKKPNILYSNELSDIELLFEGGYNTKYDRLWNRKFDNSNTDLYCGVIEYKKILEGLNECLSKFIDDWKNNNNKVFNNINMEYEEKMDEMCRKLIKERYYETND